jgi:hypothetical protein
MRWHYKVCLFLLLLGWTVFLGLAAYDTNISYSGIWYHFEHWSVSLVLSVVAAVFGLFGLGVDIRESGWKLSDFIKIEVTWEDDEDDLE